MPRTDLDRTDNAGRLSRSVFYISAIAKVCLLSAKASQTRKTPPPEIVKAHKYAPIRADEKVLLVVNKIPGWLYPISGLGIVLSDRFLYYRLQQMSLHAYETLFRKKPAGIIPLTDIRTISIGEEIRTVDGTYFGHEFFVNGQKLGLLPFTRTFNTDEIANELSQIFKALDND